MDAELFYDKLAKKYSNLIYTAIYRRLAGYGITPSHEEVADIRQEVLALIWEGKKLNKIRDPKSIPHWIAIVSGNAAGEYMRLKRRIEPEDTVLLSDKIKETELGEFLPSSELSPSEELDRNELSKKLDDAIESLPAKEKLIIKLNLLHDKKYNEIADMLNIPTGTVSSYVKRAKEKLKARLREFK